MKLTNSEVLLLTQVLYHVKCSDSYFEFSDQIHDLHSRLCSYMVGHHNENRHQDNDDENHHDGEEECVWHVDHDGGIHEDEFNDSNMEQVALKEILELEPLRTSYKDKKCSLSFEKGISASCVDINLGDGDEILCDVTHIERHANHVDINCVAGWITFEVQKFPKSWTALLQLGTPYKAV